MESPQPISSSFSNSTQAESREGGKRRRWWGTSHHSIFSQVRPRKLPFLLHPRSYDLTPPRLPIPLATLSQFLYETHVTRSTPFPSLELLDLQWISLSTQTRPGCSPPPPRPSSTREASQDRGTPRLKIDKYCGLCQGSNQRRRGGVRRQEPGAGIDGK